MKLVVSMVVNAQSSDCGLLEKDFSTSYSDQFVTAKGNEVTVDVAAFTCSTEYFLCFMIFCL